MKALALCICLHATAQIVAYGPPTCRMVTVTVAGEPIYVMSCTRERLGPQEQLRQLGG